MKYSAIIRIVNRCIPLITVLSACTVIKGSGVIMQKAVPVGDFDQIALEGFGELHVTQGDGHSLHILGDDNIVPLVEAKVAEGKLQLKFNKEHWTDMIEPSQPIVYAIEVQELKLVQISGQGDLYADDLSGGELVYTVSGTSDLHLERPVLDQLTVEVSGSAGLQVEDARLKRLALTIGGTAQSYFSGAATTQTLFVSGSFECDHRSLASATVGITVGGSSNCIVNVRDTLETDISGTATIHYLGSPKLNTHISGSGLVTAATE